MDHDLSEVELAHAWISEISVDDGILDPEREFKYAFLLDDYIDHDPDFAWSVIKIISESDMSEWAESNFSAGPLTSFVDKYANRYFDDIKYLVQARAKFKDQMLGVVFLDKVKKIFGESIFDD